MIKVDFRQRSLGPALSGPLFYLNSAILYAVNFTLYNRRVHKRERDCMTEEFDQLRRSRARAYLESVRAERVKVDALRDELAAERESMEPKGLRFDKLGGCSSAYADAIPDGGSRIEAMAERYPPRGRRKARPCSCAATFSTNRGARSPPTSDAAAAPR